MSGEFLGQKLRLILVIPGQATLDVLIGDRTVSKVIKASRRVRHRGMHHAPPCTRIPSCPSPCSDVHIGQRLASEHLPRLLRNEHFLRRSETRVPLSQKQRFSGLVNPLSGSLEKFEGNMDEAEATAFRAPYRHRVAATKRPAVVTLFDRIEQSLDDREPWNLRAADSQHFDRPKSNSPHKFENDEIAFPPTPAFVRHPKSQSQYLREPTRWASASMFGPSYRNG